MLRQTNKDQAPQLITDASNIFDIKNWQHYHRMIRLAQSRSRLSNDKIIEQIKPKRGNITCACSAGSKTRRTEAGRWAWKTRIIKDIHCDWADDTHPDAAIFYLWVSCGIRIFEEFSRMRRTYCDHACCRFTQLDIVWHSTRARRKPISDGRGQTYLWPRVEFSIVASWRSRLFCITLRRRSICVCTNDKMLSRKK